MNYAWIKNRLKDEKKTQISLANFIGISEDKLSKSLNNERDFKPQEIKLIADFFGITIDEVMAGGQQPGFRESAIMIPFQNEPLNITEDGPIIKKGNKTYLLDSGIQKEKTFALEVTDDSMNILGYLPGDVIISNMDEACKAGDVVIAQYYKGLGATTIIRELDPPFLLPRSTNLEYKRLEIGRDDVRLISPVKKMVRVLNKNNG